MKKDVKFPNREKMIKELSKFDKCFSMAQLIKMSTSDLQDEYYTIIIAKKSRR